MVTDIGKLLTRSGKDFRPFIFHRRACSAHQVTFSEVSLPRSLAFSRNCSNAASRSSTISWAMMIGTIYGKWLLTTVFLPPLFLHPDTFFRSRVARKVAGERALPIRVLFSGMPGSFQQSWSSRCIAQSYRAGLRLNACMMMNGE